MNYFIVAIVSLAFGTLAAGLIIISAMIIFRKGKKINEENSIEAFEDYNQ